MLIEHLEEEIRNLSRLQKIGIMEQIWADLIKDGGDIDVPDWHQKELQETQERVNGGKEQFMDWESAKKAIRDA